MGSGLCGSGRPFVSLLSRPAAGLVCSCLLLSFPLWPGPRGASRPLQRLLDLSWASVGTHFEPPAALGAPGTIEPSFGPLGRLLAARTDFSLIPAKAIVVSSGPSWEPLGPS